MRKYYHFQFNSDHVCYHFLDTSLIGSEDNVAQLASIDEILEYEQELAHLEKVIKAMNVT